MTRSPTLSGFERHCQAGATGKRAVQRDGDGQGNTADDLPGAPSLLMLLLKALPPLLWARHGTRGSLLPVANGTSKAEPPPRAPPRAVRRPLPHRILMEAHLE